MYRHIVIFWHCSIFRSVYDSLSYFWCQIRCIDNIRTATIKSMVVIHGWIWKISTYIDLSIKKHHRRWFTSWILKNLPYWDGVPIAICTICNFINQSHSRYYIFLSRAISIRYVIHRNYQWTSRECFRNLPDTCSSPWYPSNGNIFGNNNLTYHYPFSPGITIWE